MKNPKNGDYTWPFDLIYINQSCDILYEYSLSEHISFIENMFANAKRQLTPLILSRYF